MTEFASAPAALARLAPLDPTKHVKYTLGMVLGADDFDQEFAYLSARDRRLVRDLHGYGTVWGLAVTVDPETAQVTVAPGAAVTPCGQLVCVSPAQCASLDDWLAAHEAELREVLVSSPPTGTIRLHAVLCYRECPTDDVPIPGEPCRTEDTLAAPSRLKDDFRLELRTSRPRQPEEDGIRDLLAWLRLVPIVAGAGSPLDEVLTEIREAVAAAVAAAGSPPSPPAPPPASPPEAPFDLVLGMPPPGLTIPADAVPDYLRAVFDLWVSVLRPRLRGAVDGCEGASPCGCGCSGASGAPGETCDDDVLLLAAIDVPVVQDLDGSLVTASAGWRVDVTGRPYLLHTRLLQELLLSGWPGPVPGAPPGSPPGSPPDAPPLAGVTAHEVTGPPTATFDPLTRVLDLGIPAGAGIDEVQVTPLPPGSPATVISFAAGVLELGIAAGRDGNPGQGITAVVLIDPPPASPSASLAGGVLTLGIPQGPTGRPGTNLVVAAGRYMSATLEWEVGGLTVTPVPPTPGDAARGRFRVNFGRYAREGRYVIKGTVILRGPDEPVHTFEQVHEDDPSDEGLLVRVIADDRESEAFGFLVEVSDYSGGL